MVYSYPLNSNPPLFYYYCCCCYFIFICLFSFPFFFFHSFALCTITSTHFSHSYSFLFIFLFLSSFLWNPPHLHFTQLATPPSRPSYQLPLTSHGRQPTNLPFPILSLFLTSFFLSHFFFPSCLCTTITHGTDPLPLTTSHWP